MRKCQGHFKMSNVINRILSHNEVINSVKLFMLFSRAIKIYFLDKIMVRLSCCSILFSRILNSKYR